MKRLKLKRLLAISTSQELAGQYQFENGLNLITGNDNSIGKSTLARLPYWTLGCDFLWSPEWRALDVKSLLEFSVGDIPVIATRYRNEVRLKIGSDEWRIFPKITGEYSQVFADMVEFVGRLPNKKNPHIQETPPPAYYFSAFYVDQKRGWGDAWNSFNGLAQYSNWKPRIIRSHAGYYSPEFFELDAEIAQKKFEVEERNKRAAEFSRAAAVLEGFMPAIELSATDADLDAALSEINVTLSTLRLQENDILSKLHEKREELMFASVQRKIAEAAMKDLGDDYRFAVENIPTDTLVCPLCGTLHDNSLINRAELLQDQADAATQYEVFGQQMEAAQLAIQSQERKLSNIRDLLQDLDKRFRKLSRDSSVKDILSGLATHTVQRRAIEINTATQVESRAKQKEIKQLRAAQKEEIDLEKWNEIDAEFQAELSRLCGLLRIELSVDVSDKNPTDFNHITESGGAADGSRLHLAYHLALYHTIQKHSNEVVSPLTFDTPNQQDQSALNYEVIHKAISQYAINGTQLILCATRSSALTPYEKIAHVINLDEKKVLSSGNYSEIRSRFSQVFDQS